MCVVEEGGSGLFLFQMGIYWGPQGLYHGFRTVPSELLYYSSSFLELSPTGGSFYLSDAGEIGLMWTTIRGKTEKGKPSHI